MVSPTASMTTKKTRKMTILFTKDCIAGAFVRTFLCAFMRILHSSPVLRTNPIASVVFRSVEPRKTTLLRDKGSVSPSAVTRPS